jgi:glycosyltransferase involved in cell wall biosynthesis
MNPIVLPLGVDAASDGDATRLYAQIPEIAGKFKILYLSRLDPKKNFEGLVKALALMRAKGLTPALLVAGSGEPSYFAQLKAHVHLRGLDDQVHFLGHITGQAHADVLAAADLFVLPSFSENFGIAVVEALMAALPCVLARGVAVAPAVEQAGAGVSVEPEPFAIACAIEAYIASPDSLRAASRAALALAQEKYSVAVMGAGLEELYRAIRTAHQTSRAEQAA